ncbi:DUF308 domain-containing protein [Methyloglobulus sp.]|uniref:HdeD family acid-resistance protein n=1 Tax=Methyloglobulus sp. TaxID=2518622 RepID=UPI0032B72463
MKELDTITVGLAQMQQQMLDYMQTHWRLFLFEGLFFILLGFCAFIVPQFFSVFIVIFLGWIIIIGGVTQLSRVFLLPKTSGFGSWLGLGILQLVVGFLLIADPIAGVLTLTMMMALFFVVEGTIKIYMALQMRPLPQWEYVLFSGITAVVLALVMVAFWSDIPHWLLGVFLGVNMIMLGVAMVKMGLMHKAT